MPSLTNSNDNLDRKTLTSSAPRLHLHESNAYARLRPLWTSQQAIKFTSVAGPELRPRYKKLAQLRKTAQFVNQDALRSPKTSREKAGMLHAVWKAERSGRDLHR